MLVLSRDWLFNYRAFIKQDMQRWVDRTGKFPGCPYSLIDPHQVAEDIYSYILALLLQAKVQNNMSLLDRMEPTLMAMIDAKVPVA